jgi:hypothetical protein
VVALLAKNIFQFTDGKTIQQFNDVPRKEIEAL